MKTYKAKVSSLALALTLILAYTPFHVIAAENTAADNIALTVEVRSPRQAVITLTDSRLNALVQQNTDYFATWCVYFGADGQFRLVAEVVDNKLNGAGLAAEDAPYHWAGVGRVPVVASRHPHRPSGSPVPLEKIWASSCIAKRIDNSFIWEVSMPEGSGADFTSGNPFTVEFEWSEGGAEQDDESFEITFDAEAVVDMRNFGQEYDIGLLWEDFSLHGMAERVYGLSLEQAEQLYFSPPQSRYVTANTEVEDIYYSGNNTENPYKIEVYELIYFDESGNITQIVDKIVGADRENWSNGMNRIINAEPVFFSSVKFVYDVDNADSTIGYLYSSDSFLNYLHNRDLLSIDAYMAQVLNGSEGRNWAYTNIERHD